MATDPITRLILCGAVPVTRPPCRDRKPLHLSVYGVDPAVRVAYAQLTDLLWGKVNTLLIDFLTLAAYVYTADQAIGRGPNNDDRYGDRWRRRLFFRVALRHPDFWSQPHVQNVLVETLSFMSDDEYHFEFCHDAQPEPWRPTLDMDYCVVGDDFDDVMLFSGGLDSLAGAVAAGMQDHKKMLWIKHVSNPKYHTNVLELAKSLQVHLPQGTALVPIWVNKHRQLTHEPIQRTRTMLFTALAAIPAHYLGKDRLFFYENGIVSFNLPPASQVVGARATRTTHPRVLNGLSRLLTALTGKPFTVQNPFIWKTRREVVAILADYHFENWIRHTVSCSYIRKGSPEQPHCGVCSQCIDRRFAILAAGLEAHDPLTRYQHDFLTNVGDDPIARTMLAVYAETARTVAALTPFSFLARYGEAIRGVTEFPEPPDITLGRIADLYRRHGVAVTGVMDNEVHRHRVQVRNRTVEPTSLLGMMLDHSPVVSRTTAVQQQVPTEALNVFQTRGRGYLVRFQGGRTFILPDNRGPAYLQQLLANPGRLMAATRLLYNVVREEWLLQLSTGTTTKDAKETEKTFRRRLADNAEELRLANEREDEAEIRALERERERITTELKQYFRFDGTPRAVNDDVERVRKGVYNVIVDTVKMIRDEDPVLAAHLQKPILKTGAFCIYQPDQDIIWDTRTI